MGSYSIGLSLCSKNIADHNEFTISDLFRYIFSKQSRQLSYASSEYYMKNASHQDVYHVLIFALRPL